MPDPDAGRREDRGEARFDGAVGEDGAGRAGSTDQGAASGTADPGGIVGVRGNGEVHDGAVADGHRGAGVDAAVGAASADHHDLGSGLGATPHRAGLQRPAGADLLVDGTAVRIAV